MTIAASTLELAKVVISAFVPLAIFGAGALLAREARKHEERQWIRRKKYDTRLERWNKIAPPLNDLLCFFMCFGHFRDVTPPMAIERKRQLDRAVHANKHIFGERFMAAYDAFMAICFEINVGVGQNAKLRASVNKQRAERGPANWCEDWTPLFADQAHPPNPRVISSAYDLVLQTYDDL